MHGWVSGLDVMAPPRQERKEETKNGVRTRQSWCNDYWNRGRRSKKNVD
jgi:hypothetical protein